MKRSLFPVSLLFFSISPKGSWEHLVDEVKSAITAPFKDDSYFGFQIPDYNNVYHDLKNAQEVMSKNQSIIIDEKKDSLLISLITDIQQLTEKNVSTERVHDGVKIRIITPENSHSVFLTNNKYFVRMRSKQVYNDQKDNTKNFASNIQEMVEEGILKRYIDINSVSVEVDKNKVNITATFRLAGEENPVPVRFLHKT